MMLGILRARSTKGHHNLSLANFKVGLKAMHIKSGNGGMGNMFYNTTDIISSTQNRLTQIINIYNTVIWAFSWTPGQPYKGWRHR
eukprot:2115602-Karenia_brevis.AAC.1